MKNVFYIVIVGVFFLTCSKDKNKNSDANIDGISIISSNINDLVIVDEIDQMNGIVYLIPNIPTPENLGELKLKVDIEISSKATISPDTTSTITFVNADDAKVFKVTSESGESKIWQVRFVGNQLPNSHFEHWYVSEDINNKSYNEPGKSDSTIWATANYATSAYSLYGTTKFPEGESTQVKLETFETGTLPINSGIIYTGVFNKDSAISNPTNPILAKTFGTRFGLRPIAMKMWYRYSPGKILIKATANDTDTEGFTVTEISGEDEFIIYVILEKRIDDKVVKIARAEFSSGDIVLRMKEIEVSFEYVNSETPTHITFVALSSKDGDKFIGAIGSTLIIDNLSFAY